MPLPWHSSIPQHPAPDLTPLLTRLAEAQTAQRPALKIDPPSFNGRGDFREWKRKLELIYNAKRLSQDEKLPWTLALLQEDASRVTAHANPTNYNELMDILTRRYTDGNDAFHYRHALVTHIQTRTSTSFSNFIPAFRTSLTPNPASH